MTMTSRQRAVKALNHEEPDRVPKDMGSMNNSTIHIDAYMNLLKYLGIKESDIEEPVLERLQQIVLNPDEKVTKILGVDFTPLYGAAPDKAPNEWDKGNIFSDEWGIVWEKRKGGFYYDPIPSMAPLKDIDTIEGIRKYRWPDPDDEGRYRGIREKAKQLYNETDYAIVGSAMISIICWPWYLRGLETGLMDMVAKREYTDELVELNTNVWLKIAINFLKECGEYLDVLVVYQDDYDGQFCPIISPDIWSNMVVPRMENASRKLKEYTKAKIFCHACGSVSARINDMAAAGIDILNPVQVAAKSMGDTRMLKEEFGNKMTFWGGIDTQRVLNLGSVEDVRKEVKTRIRDLAPGGGYVVAAVHNIQRDVPPQNVVALFEAVEEYGKYPIKL